ncbi:MAG: O-antigen translocase [Flavobacteriaceae bacterium]|nr:O-antigen translocase [Flavobacteriaceae bacterium]
MRKRLKKIINHSPLLKVTSLNSVSVFIKMITGFIVNKLTAKFLGPEGMALIGNLRNFLNISHNFSVAGLEKATVKYAAESIANQEKQRTFISTLLGIGFVVCLIIGLLIFSFAEVINNQLFYKNNFTHIIQVLAFILPLHTLNVYLVAILKAYEEFTVVIKIHIIGHLLNLTLFSFLVYFYSLEGALYTLIILPSILVFASLYYFKAYWSIFKLFSFHKLDSKLTKNFGHYALMTLVSSISFPLMYLGVRNGIISELSKEAAGHWEAMNRFSVYYLMFGQNVISLYILPKLIKANSSAQFRAIVWKFYKEVIPFYLVGMICIYLFREPLILLVYTDDFLPTSDLFLYQILGDFLRLLALVISYQFHAKRMTLAFITTDLLLALCLFFFSIIFLKTIGFQGVAFGHFIAYLVYFMVILIYFRKTFIVPLVQKILK